MKNYNVIKFDDNYILAFLLLVATRTTLYRVEFIITPKTKLSFYKDKNFIFEAYFYLSERLLID